MGKFDGMLICTDLDGTLLKNDKSISKENLDKIEYFKSEGGFFTFITGRMPAFSKVMYDMAGPNCPVGCINGGGIYDFENKKYLWTTPIDKSVLEMVEHIDKNAPDVGIQINTFDKIFFCKNNSAMTWFRKVTALPNITCHYKEVKEPMAKVVFADLKSENLLRTQELLHNHPLADNFDYIRSEENLYEILPKGINKGVAIKKLAEILNIDIRKIIAIGDFHNDIAMLKAAGLGIAVANAVDEAKAVADRVTVSNEENAIATVINELDTGEIIL